MTLAKLISERRAKIEAFQTDTRVSAVHDISEVNRRAMLAALTRCALSLG
jgi:hypothetical protein